MGFSLVLQGLRLFFGSWNPNTPFVLFGPQGLELQDIMDVLGAKCRGSSGWCAAKLGWQGACEQLSRSSGASGATLCTVCGFLVVRLPPTGQLGVLTILKNATSRGKKMGLVRMSTSQSTGKLLAQSYC